MATATITIKKDTTANWTNAHRVLDDGELGLEITAEGHRVIRIGDGVKEFMALPVAVDIEQVIEIKQGMDTDAAAYLKNVKDTGDALLAEMKKEAGTVTITDEKTGKKYAMGLDDGTMYFEEKTEA